MDLTPCVPEPIWLDRFATRLGALVPSLDPQTAYAYAHTMLPEAADLTPDEAAEVWALEAPPPDELGVSGD